MDSISKLIANKPGNANLLDDLDKLPGSTLNSLLLELFRRRAKNLTSTEVLKQFENNRFVAPAAVDTIAFKQFEIRCLEIAHSKGFTPVTLSPLSTLGTCSAVGFVDQNNVMTALRGTEVVSDATNVFALQIASEFKRKANTSTIKYCAAHRHVRTQGLSNPAFTPHFGVFCMATGGRDKGDFSFELLQLVDHINIHFSIFSNEFVEEKFLLKIYLKADDDKFRQGLTKALTSVDEKLAISLEHQSDPGDYYKLVRFKFFIKHRGKEINLSDGGFVDWTQKLIPNKKHRLLISGIGTELIHKITHNQI